MEGSPGMRGVGFNPFTPGLHTWFDTYVIVLTHKCSQPPKINLILMIISQANTNMGKN